MNHNQQLWEINSSLSSSFSAGPGQTMRSILKKQPIPQRQMISIASIRDIDHIFYRTVELADNYEDVQRRINTALRQEELESVDFKDAMVHTLYLLRELLPDEKFLRVIVTSNDSFNDGRIVIMADLVDFGSTVQLIEGLHELYRLPGQLMYSPQTVAGPCRMTTDWGFDRDVDEDDEVKQLMNLTTLRNLLPAGGVFIAEIVQLPTPPTAMNVYRNDDHMHSDKKPQEEAVFYQPGSAQSINFVYQQMLQLQPTTNFSSSQRKQSQTDGGFNTSFRGAQDGFNSSARGSTFANSFGRGRGVGHGFGSSARGGGFGGGFKR